MTIIEHRILKATLPTPAPPGLNSFQKRYIDLCIEHRKKVAIEIERMLDLWDKRDGEPVSCGAGSATSSVETGSMPRAYRTTRHTPITSCCGGSAPSVSPTPTRPSSRQRPLDLLAGREAGLRRRAG